MSARHLPARYVQRRSSFFSLCARRYWQRYCKNASTVRRVLDADASSGGSDRAAHERQSKPHTSRANATVLGAEKWIEDPVAKLGRHAGAAVADRQVESLAGKRGSNAHD